MVANGRVDVPRRFGPEATARAMAERRYTFFIGVPTICSRMLPMLATAPPPAELVPWFAYGGAPMPGPLAARLEQLVPGARLVNVYGLSEASHPTLPVHPGSRPASEYAGWWDVEIIHGSGSPAAEWLQIYREYDLAGVTRHVERLAAGNV